MKKIDSLLKRAQQLTPELFPQVSLLKEQDGRFILMRGLWSGISGDRIKSIDTEHETVEEARAAYDDFLRKYPRSKKWEPVLLDVVMLTEGGDTDEETASAPVNAERSPNGIDENSE